MISKKIYRTGFFFPETGILIGSGSIFNIAGNYFDFNYSDSDEQANSKALENDWRAIGGDILNSVKENPLNEFALTV